MELSNYLYVIRKRLWLIVLTTVVTSAVVAAGVTRSAPVYEATSTLRIVPFGLNAPDYGGFVYFDRLANTYLNILNGHAVSNEARRILEISELPEFGIEIVPQTELIRLNVTDSDPERARDVADTLTQLLIMHNQSTYTSSELQATLQTRLNETEAQIEAVLRKQDQLQEDKDASGVLWQTLNEELRGLRQTHDSLLASYNQASTSQLALANALSVIEPAAMPQFPAGPGVVQMAAVAGSIGMLGGIALAFLLESQRPRFHTNQQIEAATKLSIIGKVPFTRKRYRDDLYMTDPVAVEAFRRLRVNGFTDGGSKPLRSFVVVSALPEEGKSTIAANLALSIASIGRKVLLVDADMYQARLSRRNRLTHPSGLSEILQGTKELEEVVMQSDRNPNLSLLTVGDKSSHPSELLGSFDFDALIKQILQTYDVVIFDTPPLFASTDALIIAPHVEGALWVIDRARIDQPDVLEARDQLNTKNTNVIGIVVNRVAADKSFQWYRRYARLPEAKSMNGNVTAIAHSKN